MCSQARDELVFVDTLESGDQLTSQELDGDGEKEEEEKEEKGEEDGEEIELRLFADPPNALLPQTYKIRLSPVRADGQDAGLRVKKPVGYYFANEPTDEQQRALEAAAMEGSAVLELSRIPWPGCALPWKVCCLSAAGIKREKGRKKENGKEREEQKEERVRKRTRMNKKTRIATRIKRQIANDQRVEAARLAREKDAAEREKRTRRNREKKVKRKAREKAKKGKKNAGQAADDGGKSAEENEEKEEEQEQEQEKGSEEGKQSS